MVTFIYRFTIWNRKICSQISRFDRTIQMWLTNDSETFVFNYVLSPRSIFNKGFRKSNMTIVYVCDNNFGRECHPHDPGIDVDMYYIRMRCICAEINSALFTNE